MFFVKLVLLFSTFSLFAKSSTLCGHGSTCQENESCCSVNSVLFACCSFSDGICCEDQIHCCPYGTKCDLENQNCSSPSFIQYSIPMKTLVKANYPIEVNIDKLNSTIPSPKDIFKCIKSIPPIARDIDQALKEYEEKDMAGVIKELSKAMVDIKNMLDLCSKLVEITE